MALQKAITFKKQLIPDAYSRITRIVVDVVDRADPKIIVVCGTYASKEARDDETREGNPLSEVLQDIQIILKGDEAEAWIQQFAPNVYATLKTKPEFEGAVDA